MKRLILTVLYVFLCLGMQAAASFPFRHIGIRDGLPDNYVKNVFGLPDGRLGVRTTSLLSFTTERISSTIRCGRLRSMVLTRNQSFLFSTWMPMEESG